MAVSPFKSPIAGMSGAAIANAKARALTVLNKKPPPSPASTPAAESDVEAPRDLAEQLNQQERDKYVRGNELGSGTYAWVYKGHVRSDPSQLVAIKKMKLQPENKDGLSMDSIREVKYLQELAHPNIITLLSVFSSKDQNLNLVLELLPHGDLEMMIKEQQGVQYGLSDIKAWMGMLGRAVWFCHENFVLHRDIKPGNLLIAASGELKLADFGLARSFADPYAPMTSLVITSWYRPPELFYKARFYSGAVDVWSVGCVLAELVLRSPYLHGMTDIDVLSKICQELGHPTDDNWPGVTKLENYVVMGQPPLRPLITKAEMLGLFGTLGSSGVDLLMGLLVLDPRKRLTAKQMLEHEFFKIDPRPTKTGDLPKKGGGEAKVAEDLKRKGGEITDGRTDKVAKKLDFGAMKR